jgi:hypothetical protein
LAVVIVGLKEGKITRIRIKLVLDASVFSLERAIKECIEPGSIVQTDGWIGYAGLPKRGYTHEIIRKEPLCGRTCCLRLTALPH